MSSWRACYLRNWWWLERRGSRGTIQPKQTRSDCSRATGPSFVDPPTHESGQVFSGALSTTRSSSLDTSGESVGLPHLSPLQIGLVNFHSWALLAMTLLAILTGYGRTD